MNSNAKHLNKNPDYMKEIASITKAFNILELPLPEAISENENFGTSTTDIGASLVQNHHYVG